VSWESQGIVLLAASVVRPLALVAAAWVMLRLLRVRHPASRHSVWTGVLVGMMVLPFVSVFAPHWMVPVLPAKRVPAATVAPKAVVSDAIGLSIPQSMEVATPARVFERPSVETLAIWCYLAGLLGMVAYRLAGWVLLWRVMLRSRPLRGRVVRESDDVLTPVAVGVLRPFVILPAGWREWDTNTRRAVLAHEFAHLRRHDAVVSALAWWVRCLFWFHPLAWWVSREVSDLAELACDAAAVERVGDPAGYSRMLLGFADTVNRAGHRVALPGLAMAGSGVDRRIDGVFQLSGGNLRKLSRPGVFLALAGVPVMCLAATVGLGESGGPLPRPSPVSLPILAQSLAPAFGAPPVKPPLVVAQQSVPPRIASPSVPTPKFDVASIKLSKDCGGGPGRVGGTDRSSPGRLRLNCFSVQRLIGFAYGSDAVNNRPPKGVPIEGGSPWVDSDLYAIEAEAEGSPDRRTMHGPMLQALLEDRLQLKIHRETREIPVYALTVAKGGPKLQPFQDGSCVRTVPGEPRPAPSEKPFCGLIGMRRGKSGPNITWDVVGVKFVDFSQYFGLILDRPLIDRTGITGVDFHLEFAPDETTASVANPFGPDSGVQAAPSDPAGGLSIFTAFQEQLGLKLESAKGPGEFLVIDHVERPSEN